MSRLQTAVPENQPWARFRGFAPRRGVRVTRAAYSTNFPRGLYMSVKEPMFNNRKVMCLDKNESYHTDILRNSNQDKTWIRTSFYLPNYSCS